MNVEQRIKGSASSLPAAEQRMAQFFLQHRQVTVLGSAAQIAEHAGVSDATVVRTAKSLGFAGLAELREALLSDLVAPDERLRRTLQQADAAGGVLGHVLDLHQETLEVFKNQAFSDAFERAIALLAAARHRHVFGVGPSGAVADYATLQFNRIGLDTTSLSATGIALADRLLPIGEGDALLMIAYAPIYREVRVVLDQARLHAIPVVLVSDNLGAIVGGSVHEVLPVPRGTAGNLAMHAGTMVLVEAMVAGMAARNRDAALESLGRLTDLRGSLDKSWLRRGVKRRQSRSVTSREDRA